LRGLARGSRGQGSKAVVQKKKASQRLRITETDLFNKRTRERSVTIIARRLYRKWACDDYITANDTITESECITMTESVVR